MPEFSNYDIFSGRSFIPQILQDSKFRNNGVIYGSNKGLYWAVVNPRKHPLYVWEKKGKDTDAYSKSALALGSVVFSNGPQMGRFTKAKAYLMATAIVSGTTVTGTWAGLKAGGKLGAKIGSIGGFKGAIIGGFIGALAGALMGYYLATNLELMI